MRHVFIINPAAGKRNRTEEYSAKIRAELEKRGEPYEILVSQKRGDCMRLAREAAEQGDEVRIYACGGDGTLNEVANGAAGFANAAITSFPGGSGNDFIKCFSEREAFFDLSRLLDAETAEFDMIRCGDRLAINICSMGLDARIGVEVGTYKRWPLVSGTGAYIISTVVNVVRGIHRPYRVWLDDELFEGHRTLICIANGRHYGGGFHPVPGAKLNDGLLDVLLITGVSRLMVPALIGKYAAGRYAELPGLVQFRRCKRVVIEAEREEAINLDGEEMRGKTVAFSVAEEKIRFFYPRGLTYKA